MPLRMAQFHSTWAIASTRGLICAEKAVLLAAGHQNKFAIRHNGQGEPEFFFPYYENRAASDEKRFRSLRFRVARIDIVRERATFFLGVRVLTQRACVATPLVSGLTRGLSRRRLPTHNTTAVPSSARLDTCAYRLSTHRATRDASRASHRLRAATPRALAATLGPWYQPFYLRDYTERIP